MNSTLSAPRPSAAGKRFLRRIDPRLRGSAGDRIAYAARKDLRGQAALDKIRASYAASAERLPGWDAVVALCDQHPEEVLCLLDFFLEREALPPEVKTLQRQARKDRHLTRQLSTRPPTTAQIDLLNKWAYSGPAPRNGAEARDAIQALKSERGAVR